MRKTRLSGIILKYSDSDIVGSDIVGINFWDEGVPALMTGNKDAEDYYNANSGK